MKKNYFATLALMCLLFFGLTTQAQLRVGANVGLMNYYGDASDAGSFSFPFSSAGLGAGVFAEKSIGGFFIPQAQLFYGKISANKDYLDVTANGSIIDLSLKLQFDIAELVKKDAKLQIMPHVGGVLGFYNTEVTRTSSGAIVDAGHVNNDAGYGSAFGVDFGGRVGYEFNPKWTGFVSMDTRFFLSDEIDDYRGIKSASGIAGNDWTNYVHVGVAYTIKPKSDELPEEPAPLIAEKENKDAEVNGLFTYNNMPKQGVQMNLFDANDTKMASTVTDINGQFKFDGLNPDENYVVRLGEEDKGLFNSGKMYVMNNEGQRVAAANKPGFNTFTFTQLTEEATEALPMLVEDKPTADMSGVFVYNELPKGGVKIYLVDENDNKLDSAITRADGSFKFSKLDPSANYVAKLDEKDATEFKGASMFFTNDKGEPVMRASSSDKGFGFKAMDKEELATLDVLTAEDGTLMYRKVKDEKPTKEAPVAANESLNTDAPKTSTPANTAASSGKVNFENETIYFRHNSFWISQNQQGSKGSIIAKKLKENPNMRIRIEGWASQPGDENYNQSLSQKRAEALKDLIVNNYGIAANRIEAVGKGEVMDNKVPEAEARRARIYVID